MEGNEFKNGLIGHKVEGKLYDKTVQGVYVGQALDDDGHQWDRIVTDTGDILCIIVSRVIRPQGEVVKPAEPEAEPYSIETAEGRARLWNEVLMPNRYSQDSSMDHVHVAIFKNGDTAFIEPSNDGTTYVYHTSFNGINIPLNDWVLNPTVESLKPPKDN